MPTRSAKDLFSSSQVLARLLFGDRTTLEKVQSFDAATIIPGHGPLMWMADAARLHKMIDDFYSGVVSGYKKNLTDSEVRKTLDLTEWKRLKNYEAMGMNISRAYLEAEADNF